jgi:hypothetical protein
MRWAHASCLAIEAGRTLIFDPASVLSLANQAGIAILGVENG